MRNIQKNQQRMVEFQMNKSIHDNVCNRTQIECLSKLFIRWRENIAIWHELFEKMSAQKKNNEYIFIERHKQHRKSNNRVGADWSK